MSQDQTVMQRLLDAAGWDAGSLRHKQLEAALDGACLEIRGLAQQTPGPTLREQFESVITALNYDGNDTDSLTVGEIRRALP